MSHCGALLIETATNGKAGFSFAAGRQTSTILWVVAAVSKDEYVSFIGLFVTATAQKRGRRGNVKKDPKQQNLFDGAFYWDAESNTSNRMISTIVIVFQ